MPDDVILVEREARNTGENIEFTGACSPAGKSGR